MGPPGAGSESLERALRHLSATVIAEGDRVPLAATTPALRTAALAAASSHAQIQAATSLLIFPADFLVFFSKLPPKSPYFGFMLVYVNNSTRNRL